MFSPPLQFPLTECRSVTFPACRSARTLRRHLALCGGTFALDELGQCEVAEAKVESSGTRTASTCRDVVSTGVGSDMANVGEISFYEAHVYRSLLRATIPTLGAI
jgi:hypothetical protein